MAAARADAESGLSSQAGSAANEKTQQGVAEGVVVLFLFFILSCSPPVGWCGVSAYELLRLCSVDNLRHHQQHAVWW